MVKDNFKAWMVRVEDFHPSSSLQEQIKFLLGFAVLAPSTHNSQPWLFRIERNKVLIQPNLSKTLPVGDRDNQFLYLSLGCALENLLVATEYYGFSTEIEYPSVGNGAIQVTFIGTGKFNLEYNQENLIWYIAKRITNRHKFTDQMPPTELLSLISNLKTENLNIGIISPGEQHDQIKSLVSIITPALLNEPNFRKELSSYVRTNITRSKIGMPAFVMGVPMLPSLLVPTILKYINIEKFSKKKEEGATNTKVFIVISTEQDNKEDWVKSGQILQKINLLATKFGLFTHPMAAPIHDVAGRKELQKILQTKFKPQFLFRLGYGTKSVRHSPRMPVEDCLI